MKVIERNPPTGFVLTLILLSVVGSPGAKALAQPGPRQHGEPPPFGPEGRPNRGRPGPWNNDVLVYRVGSGGRVEKLGAFERAGVPTAARLKDGRLIAAHQHFPADSDADFDKVAVRFSSDEGRTWTGPQVIRLGGLPEGMRFPFDPTLVPLPDGRVRLYFTSVENRKVDARVPAIHSAVSADGIEFKVEPGVRFAVEGRPVIDCAVALHRGVFHLYAPDNGAGGPPGSPLPGGPGARQPSQPGAAYHATSEDGLVFQRQPDVRIEGRRRWLGNAQSDGEAIRFFGTGDPGGPGRPGGVWVATSDDGGRWELQDGFAPVPAADPGAVKLQDGSWLVIATGPPRRKVVGDGSPPEKTPEKTSEKTPDPPRGDRAHAGRRMEALGRGVVAVRRADGTALVSWRLLGTDPEEIAFHLYRQIDGSPPARLTREPLRTATCFTDDGAAGDRSISYFVRSVLDGVEGPPCTAFTLPAGPPRPYVSIPLQTPPGYLPNDASVGDLDGDGEYEIVLHQASGGRDNSQRGLTGEPILEAYKLDGTLLWRIRLGRNIREGAHYTQFLVYDLDGDGRSEVATKTADGTVDGRGTVIGDASADHRNAAGYVLDGPEFLTVFDGRTGAALATTDYLPPRGRVADWGDDYGNRVDRFLGCIAYLDGKRPSLVMCRGYYTRTVLVAWNWRDGVLRRVWTFDSDDGVPGNRAYRGQGNHGLSVGDLDGDGRDEIIYGASAIDDDGRGLYSTGLGHGDALHLADIDPRRPGLEVFAIHEKPSHSQGAEIHDARTGQVLWGKRSADPGRGLALDIDPRHSGLEMWASGEGLEGLWDVQGERISDRKPRSSNFGVWWDGDLLRELLDGTAISKWDWAAGSERRLLTAEGCAANNGTKATPCLSADILGDWREEVLWRTVDGRELRLYVTSIATEHRLPTLMHDPQYRLAVAWQNVGYNQPPHPGYFLGEGMEKPPRPAIMTR